MNDILLTISQALQLVAIAPCLFVIGFLLFTGRRSTENVLPALYFAALSCSFLLPLFGLFPPALRQPAFRGVLLMGESTTAPFSFLLILQFLLGRVPPLPYWLILALPLVGGSPFVYMMLSADDICLGTQDCYSTASLHTLYNVFSTALIFLLLIYKLSASSARIAIDEVDRTHKYWLIVALVMLNLILAVLDLTGITGSFQPDNVLLASTIIRITFIYLVLTSVFVLFYELFEISAGGEAQGRVRTQELDRGRVEKIRQMLEQEGLYREMGLTRKSLADRLGLSEHQASRIINAYFRKNFNELINGYRVDEAKRRLSSEDSAITVIAFEVGFNSIASFNRVFKELVGSAPSEYRVANKQAAATASAASVPAAVKVVAK